MNRFSRYIYTHIYIYKRSIHVTYKIVQFKKIIHLNPIFKFSLKIFLTQIRKSHRNPMYILSRCKQLLLIHWGNLIKRLSDEPKTAQFNNAEQIY